MTVENQAVNSDFTNQQGKENQTLDVDVSTEVNGMLSSVQTSECLPEVSKEKTKNISTSEDSVAGRSQQKIKKDNLFYFFLIFAGGAFSLYQITSISWKTWIWGVVLLHYGHFGQLGGAHRLWSHRSFKASLPLRVLLMLGHSMTMTYPIMSWARDHRVHHKYTDTDADPHNAKRGFWYSHLTWMFRTKHPETIRRGKEVDITDLLNDSVVVFEKRYHFPLLLVMGIIFPVVIPVYLWNETWTAALAANAFRINVILHSVSSINSLAHLYGYRPFNKSIMAAQNPFVSLMSGGEGWHNYHHVFPWDYRASEIGALNTTMHLIRLSGWLGAASDLKTAPRSLVRRVARRYGDGTRDGWVARAPEVPVEAVDDPSRVDEMAAPPAASGVGKAPAANGRADKVTSFNDKMAAETSRRNQEVEFVRTRTLVRAEAA